MTWRQSNNQWSDGIVAHPTPKISSAKIHSKSSRLGFSIQRRQPLHWLFSKGPTLNAEYYSSLLVQLKDILMKKGPGKFTKGVLFLHDNAPAHLALATQKKLIYLGFQCLDHPPYSLDVAPSDYHLFHELEKTIESSPFFVRRGGHFYGGDLVGRTTF